MSTFIDEKTVMQFYIDCIDNDSIEFLKGREEMKATVRGLVGKLLEAETMNSKITIAVSLWKKLFEAAMSFISPDKRGYDKLFKYFDAYVEFEELIFASDSFYRDHTLHCIWVYFLGEYVARKEEFTDLFIDMRQQEILIQAIDVLGISKGRATAVKKAYIEYMGYKDSARCVAALTHDLGYPLKKIEKINKSISKVLPYFSVNDFTDFNFDFGSLQQEFVNSFIDFISREFSIKYANTEAFDQEADTEATLEHIRHLLSSVFDMEGVADSLSIVGVN